MNSLHCYAVFSRFALQYYYRVFLSLKWLLVYGCLQRTGTRLISDIRTAKTYLYLLVGSVISSLVCRTTGMDSCR